MTIRNRSSLVIVSAVLLMLLLFSTMIYFLFVNNHQKQFYSLLKDKALQTVKLLEEVKEVDSALLSVIDAHILHDWRNEKTIVLNMDRQVVYSSVDDHRISWDTLLLEKIRTQKELYYREGEFETAGIFYDNGGLQRYVLVAAIDPERSSLYKDWRLLLLGSCLFILLVILFTAYFFAGRALQPLSELQKHIHTAAFTPNTFSPVQGTMLASKDEIASLATSYNDLMKQLQQYDVQQKQFIRFASHELRTPLAVLMSQIDHALLRERSPEEYRTLLMSLQKDHDQLAQLISRLLFISKSEQIGPGDMKSRVSLYAVAEDCIDKIGQQHPEVKFSLAFSQSPTNPEDYDMSGDEVLLQAAIENMLSNAVKYGAGTPVAVLLTTDKEQVSIEVMNGGPCITTDEVDQLFTPFFRASNKGRQPGSGLGLVLLQKVVHCHGGSIDYRIRDGKNAFFIQFPRRYNP
jgi:signal transduction histidine kinase